MDAFVCARDLSNNSFFGSLPPCFQFAWISFAGNALTGKVPSSYFNISSLKALDASNNQLSGKLPRQIGENMSLEILEDLSEVVVIGIQSSLYSGGDVFLYNIMMVDIITKGNLHAYSTDHLLLMSGIDLSANKLKGSIPPEIENLDELLSGTIARQLTQLKFLEVFSVAYNNLSGCTPDFKDQFGTFDKSSYEGNVRLHGPPLEKTCTSASSPIVPPQVEKNQEDSNVEDDAIFFAILVASFVAGFWGCITFLSCHHTGLHIRSILDGYVDSLTERIIMAAHKRNRMQRSRR
ncbi:cuscuta receptor 1-like [Elaeis guineensis]|uniref:cuscuta receptor 1-like n=1 Tax=Elaeis guineensis var. tenera TaxID=51953 RepID=UPI003C6DAA01